MVSVDQSQSGFWIDQGPVVKVLPQTRWPDTQKADELMFGLWKESMSQPV